MRVINFLPWRETLYRRRRRNFFMVLSAITATIGVPVFATLHSDRLARVFYDARVADLQATLTHVGQYPDVLQQALLEAMTVSNRLQSRLRQWEQQREWQQIISEWQLLAAGVNISEIRWQGGELLLRGHTEIADPLRRLMHQSPQWQLEQLELDVQARYQFTLSRAMQTQ